MRILSSEANRARVLMMLLVHPRVQHLGVHQPMRPVEANIVHRQRKEQLQSSK